MIVDAHVGISRERYNIERVMKILGAARIQRAVIFADSRAQNLPAQNAYVLEAAREYDLFPFYYLGGNPWTDTRPDSLELPDNFDEYAGVRWHRWIGEGVDREGKLDRDELDWAVSLMESADFESFTSAAAHYNMPVIFEESLSVTLEFVNRYPTLDIIIPHLGAQSGGELNVMRELWEQPHVYFDTSLSQIDETALARLGPERLLFGSGFPYGDPDMELDKIDRLTIPESVKEGIFGDNVLALLDELEEEL